MTLKQWISSLPKFIPPQENEYERATRSIKERATRSLILHTNISLDEGAAWEPAPNS